MSTAEQLETIQDYKVADIALAECVSHRFTDSLIFRGQDGWGDIENRNLRTEGGQDRSQLAACGCTADDGDRLGQLL